MKTLMNFWKNEDGIETLEYAAIGAIVVAVALLIYGSGWGTEVQNTLKEAAAPDTSGATL
jgi:Flp pilus assembly pilin Flp